MTLEHHQLVRFFERCDPFSFLSPTDDRYVELDDKLTVRGGGRKGCIDLLYRTIARKDPFGQPSCQLFSGFYGSGKTTELMQLSERLQNQPPHEIPTRVIHVRCEDFLDPFAQPSVIDVLRIIAYHLDCAASGQDPYLSEDSSYLERLYKYIAGLSVEIKSTYKYENYGFRLMFSLKHNPSFNQKIREILSQRFQQFVEEARQSIEASVAKIRAQENNLHYQIVVIVDGLEHIRALHTDDREKMEDSVERLFLQHAEFLRLPSCHAIYTFPLWLRFRSAELGNRYDQDPPVLPMVKLRDREGNLHSEGIQHLRQLVSKRLDGHLADIFGSNLEDTLDPIILASGGYVRDLLRMLRRLLTDVDVDEFPVTRQETDRIIDLLSEEYRRLIRQEDIDLLRIVSKTHDLPIGNPTDIAKFGRLLDRWLILAYRNGHEWYDVHPLIRKFI